MPVGHHEFRVCIGDGKFFLSHFPRFSSIHAYQYIVEVSFDDDSRLAIEKDVKEDIKRERRYQLEPFRKGPVSADRAEDEDDWVLPDTLKAGKSFNGDIFHFEGEERQVVGRNVTATVKGIVWKEELNPRFPRPKALTYVLFGTPKAAFLAHQLSAPHKPGKQETDFDHVLSVDVVAASREVTPTSVGKRVCVSGAENIEKNKLEPGQRIKLSLVGSEQEFIEVVVKDELQMHRVPIQR